MNKNKDFLQERYSSITKYRYNPISNFSYHFLFNSLRHFNKLYHLKISIFLNKLCTDETINSVAYAIRNLKSLQRLEITIEGQEGRTTEKSWIALTKALANLQNLKILKIHFPRCNPTNTGLNNLSVALAKLSNIKTLELSLGYALLSPDYNVLPFSNALLNMNNLRVLAINFSFTKNTLPRGWLCGLSRAFQHKSSLESLNYETSWLALGIVNNTAKELGELISSINNLKDLTFSCIYGDIKSIDVQKIFSNDVDLSKLSALRIKFTSAKAESQTLIDISRQFIKTNHLLDLELSFGHNINDKILNESCIYIQELKGLQNLVFDFNKCEITHYGLRSMFNGISYLKNLKKLKISCLRLNSLPKLDNTIQEDFDQSMNNKFDLKQLNTIDFYFNNFFQLGKFIPNLIGQSENLLIFKLYILSIHKINDDMVIDLFNQLDKHKALKIIDLNFPKANEIGDRGIARIAEIIPSFKQIEYLKLNFFSSQIRDITTNGTLQLFTGLKASKTLKSLNLTFKKSKIDNDKIKDLISRLKKGIPNFLIDM